MTAMTRLSAVAVAALLPVALATGAAGQEPPTPVAYVNPDSGMPTENGDVDSASSCEIPDQADDQAIVSDPATDNVHVDACLLSGTERVDAQATFDVTGVGEIRACPDPDGDGPKTATASDRDGDGADDRCVLSGYEDANTEYHLRVVSSEAGTQTVTFCADPEGDGCDDATTTSTVTVEWGAAGEAEGLQPVAYVNPDTDKPTANDDVEPGSSCEQPDRTDRQDLVADPATDNVHVDACLFDGTERADAQATFELDGVGAVFACPDPDMDGPKTATASDTDGDGANDRCVLSGYEDANTEYHLRVVSSEAGVQVVTFCEDPEGDGCANAPATSSVTVTWGEGTTAPAPSAPPADDTAAPATDQLPNTGPAEHAMAIALTLLLSALVLRRATASARP